MKTISLLFTTLVLVIIPPLYSAEKPSPPRELSQAKAVLTKHFLVAMRRNDHSSLRKTIHPDYLAKYGLTEVKQLPMEIVPVLGIHHFIPTPDSNEILCLYKTKTGEKECLLLRFKMEGDTPYFHPPVAPDPKTDKFTPWLLRQNLKKFFESK